MTWEEAKQWAKDNAVEIVLGGTIGLVGLGVIGKSVYNACQPKTIPVKVDFPLVTSRNVPLSEVTKEMLPGKIIDEPWYEEGALNMIVGDLTTKDLGRLGRALDTVPGVSPEDSIDVVLGIIKNE